MAEHEKPPPDGTAPDPHPGYDRVAARETVVMYNALAYVLAGPLTFGPVGWGLDQLFGTSFLLQEALGDVHRIVFALHPIPACTKNEPVLHAEIAQTHGGNLCGKQEFGGHIRRIWIQVCRLDAGTPYDACNVIHGGVLGHPQLHDLDAQLLLGEFF